MPQVSMKGLTGGVRCREGVQLGPLVGRLGAQLLVRHGVLVYTALLHTHHLPYTHHFYTQSWPASVTATLPAHHYNSLDALIHFK